MSDKESISTLTKVLIKKTHGGRKADSKFWNDQVDLNNPAPPKVQKDKPRSRKRSIKLNPYIIGLIAFAIFDLIALQFYATYKETGKIPLIGKVTSFWDESEDGRVTNKVDEYTPHKAVTTSKKRQNALEKGISKIYSWKDTKGNTYCTANHYKIPKNGYVSLEYMFLDKKKIYCWENKKGQKLYANGLPARQNDEVFRLMSIK